MQITSISEIIGGELLNSPIVSSIYNIKTDVSKVFEGDLFFARDTNEIKEAISKGAFAIVISQNIQISDNEIAWIKVKNINKSIIKFIRFQLSQIELHAYYCDSIRFKLIKILSMQSQNIWYFSNNLDDMILKLNNIKNGDTLFCSNEDILTQIYPNFKTLKNINPKIDNLIEHSLFETSFSYKQSYFSRIKLSYIYINHFLDVASFLNFNIDITKLKKFDFFKPIFIDNFSNICEYGKSNKFIIVQKNLNTAKNEIEHLNKKYAYAKKIIASNVKLNLDDKEYILIKNIEELFSYLQNIEFNSLYIVGYKIKEVEEFLEKNSSKHFLF